MRQDNLPIKNESPKKVKRSPHKKRDQKSQIKEYEKSYTLKENFQLNRIRVQQGIKLQDDRFPSVPLNLVDPRLVSKGQKLDFELKKDT